MGKTNNQNLTYKNEIRSCCPGDMPSSPRSHAERDTSADMDASTLAKSQRRSLLRRPHQEPSRCGISHQELPTPDSPTVCSVPSSDLRTQETQSSQEPPQSQFQPERLESK